MNAVVPMLSNLDTVITTISADISRNLNVASGSSFDSLQAHARVGQGLEELQKHVAPRTFSDYVKTNFGLKKQWRCRLMKLSKEWPHVLTAIEWAKAKGEIKRSEYSVDGALALVAKWRREECGYAPEVTSKSSSGRNRRSSSPGEAGNSTDLHQLLTLTSTALKQAKAYIRFLETEIERLNQSGVVNPPLIDLHKKFDEEVNYDNELPGLTC